MLVSTILQLLEENIQNMNSFVYANMLPSELGNQFDYMANKFVDAHFKPSLAGSLQGIDETEIQLDNLRNLKATYTGGATLLSGSDYYLLFPENYRNLLNDKVTVVSACHSTLLDRPTRVIGDEAWETTKINPFAKPTEVSPISKVISDRFIVNAGGRVVSTITLAYIIKLPKLDVETVDAEYNLFPDEVILKIIDLTRNRILELIQGERISTAVQESQNFNVL